MYVLGSDITIGNFSFSGVNDISINRSLHSITETATIKIPSIARIVTKASVSTDVVITGKQFSEGDPVTIKLGYNNDLQTEFTGFVKRCSLSMPLEVECEGYSWLLRRNTIDKFYPSVTVKDLLADAVSGIEGKYNISVQCKADITLSNVKVSGCGLDVINGLSKYTDGCLSCFFIQPGVLWCGLLYTPYAKGTDILNTGTVNYRLGYNVPKTNDLKERTNENDPVQVEYSKKLANGDKLSGTSDAFKIFVRTHKKILNHIADAIALKQLANETAYRRNYAGYEGSINTFLQPYATPGYTAYITDDRYPERNGNYIIEDMEVHFGNAGARRIIGIGPQLGFAKNNS